jgi:hypothetical protein
MLAKEKKLISYFVILVTLSRINEVENGKLASMVRDN